MAKQKERGMFGSIMGSISQIAQAVEGGAMIAKTLTVAGNTASGATLLSSNEMLADAGNFSEDWLLQKNLTSMAYVEADLAKLYGGLTPPAPTTPAVAS